MFTSTRLIMGMPITVSVVDDGAEAAVEEVFAWFNAVDARYSTYKPDSEIMRLNRGEIPLSSVSPELKSVLDACEATRLETRGFFDIKNRDGILDPSGYVKGWSINEAAKLLDKQGFKNFFIDAGGDIQPRGLNEEGTPWSVGIKNPFKQTEIVKVVYLKGDKGIATSGSYIRGAHIYDPHDRAKLIDDIVSLTVIASDVLEADRFATAAFAMGADGIRFIEQLPGFEGYAIDAKGIATMTTGFEKYLCSPSSTPS